MKSTKKQAKKGEGMSSSGIDIFNAAKSDRVYDLASALKENDPNLQDHNGLTLLHYAAANLAFGTVDLLLSQEKIDPTLPDRFGRTADVMPLLVFRSLGEEMANKLRPHCHPETDETPKPANF